VWSISSMVGSGRRMQRPRGARDRVRWARWDDDPNGRQNGHRHRRPTGSSRLREPMRSRPPRPAPAHARDLAGLALADAAGVQRLHVDEQDRLPAGHPHPRTVACPLAAAAAAMAPTRRRHTPRTTPRRPSPRCRRNAGLGERLRRRFEHSGRLRREPILPTPSPVPCPPGPPRARRGPRVSPIRIRSAARATRSHSSCNDLTAAATPPPTDAPRHQAPRSPTTTRRWPASAIARPAGRPPVTGNPRTFSAVSNAAEPHHTRARSASQPIASLRAPGHPASVQTPPPAEQPTPRAAATWRIVANTPTNHSGLPGSNTSASVRHLRLQGLAYLAERHHHHHPTVQRGCDSLGSGALPDDAELRRTGGHLVVAPVERANGGLIGSQADERCSSSSSAANSTS